ncbi:MAG: methyltransferase domain-containing protein [Pseudomonadota bacterium]|nr:methyltransferase domain-containing protein [Pseudomonadota bacterium]
MSILSKIRRHGLAGSFIIGYKLLLRKIRAFYYKWRFSNAPQYSNPTHEELSAIENDLQEQGIVISDFRPSTSRFREFQNENWFPVNYHGGKASGVWDEKLLEHWIADQLLGLSGYGADDIYVDVAAGSSPWAKTLRARRNMAAYAIDMAPVSGEFFDLSYYRMENATQSSFKDESVRGVSLQCAYEMFMQEDDTYLINELARILKPGGKAIILPLYMHTHYCAYATPEYFGKGYSDPKAKEYVRMDCSGIPSSRKYDAYNLKQRVIETILREGMKYRLLVLRNKAELGSNIYCHFILEIEK